MKKELRRIPLVGYACEVSGQIYVDNSSPVRLRRTMERAEAQLSSGMSVVVFPEGARTWDGSVRRFKRGAYTLAMEFSLPVVPLTIDGAFHVLPRFRRFPRPGHIRLTIHKPILPPAEGHNLAELIDASRAAVVAPLGHE